MISMNISKDSDDRKIGRDRSESPSERQSRTRKRIENPFAKPLPVTGVYSRAPGTPAYAPAPLQARLPPSGVSYVAGPVAEDAGEPLVPPSIASMFGPQTSAPSPHYHPSDDAVTDEEMESPSSRSSSVVRGEEPVIRRRAAVQHQLQRRADETEEMAGVPPAAIAVVRGLIASGAHWTAATATGLLKGFTVKQLKDFCTGVLTITTDINPSDVVPDIPRLTLDQLHRLSDPREAKRIIATKATKNVVVFFLSAPMASMAAAPGRTTYTESIVYNTDEKRLTYGINNKGELVIRDYATGKFVVKSEKEFRKTFLDSGLGRPVFIGKNDSAFINLKLFFLCFTVKTNADGTMCIPNSIGTRTAAVAEFKNSASVRALIESVAPISGANRSIFSEVYQHFKKSPVPLPRGVANVIPDLSKVIQASAGCLAIDENGNLNLQAYEVLNKSYDGVLTPLKFAPFFKAANACTFGLASRPINTVVHFEKFEEALKIVTSIKAVTELVTEVLTDDPIFLAVWLAANEKHTGFSTDTYLKAQIPAYLRTRCVAGSAGKGIFIHQIRSALRDTHKLSYAIGDTLKRNEGSTVFVLDKALQVSSSFLTNGVGSIYDPVLQTIFTRYPKALKTIVPTTRIGHHLHVFPQYGKAIVRSPVAVSRGFYHAQAIASVNIQHQIGQYDVLSILSGHDPVSPLAAGATYKGVHRSFQKHVGKLASHFFSTAGKKGGIHAIEKALSEQKLNAKAKFTVFKV